MIIDWREISTDALHGLAEQFVHTESGEETDDSMTLEQKAAQVVAAIKRGELVITFSDLHQSAYLQPKDKFTAQTDEDWAVN